MILSRRLAQAIGQMKLEAARTRSAMRITFPADGALTYLIETAPACASTSWQKVREGGLASSDRQAGKFRMVSGGDGQRLGISGLTQSLCYDSLLGAGVTEFRAFAILPVNDLALGDDRRASVLLVEGPSAEMSFE